MMPQHTVFFDGQLHAGEGEPIQVDNPSNGQIVTTVNGASLDQVKGAIASARSAFNNGAWSGLPRVERAEKVRALIAALAARSAAITDIVVAEAGCPRHSPVMAAQVLVPLHQANDLIDLYLSMPETEDNPLPAKDRVNAMGQVVQSLRRYSPIGVVAGIAAYNFPFYTALWKVIPAILTGNTVILRPSPLTPLSAMMFAEAAQAADIPSGVINIVCETGLEGGQLLSTDVAVDMVAFTGSSKVGELIMAQAAPTMKRLQLELGGKSAQIFLPDALDQVIPAAMGVFMGHAGQGCAHGTRLFVPEEAKEALLQQLAGAVSSIKVGSTEDPETQMGPVISATQVARCEHYVAAAQEHGGRVVVGGQRPDSLADGFFFQATVLDLPDNKNPAAQDEIFGPVVSVIGYKDLDHAIEMANDSRFGLSGYVHGKDKRTAYDLALRMKTGTVNVNAGMMSAYVSSGGQRASGIGRERGEEGLRIFEQMTCINLGG